MPDKTILKRAWDVLEVGERPVGLTPCGLSGWCYQGVPGGLQQGIDNGSATDRLIVAVEGVLLKTERWDLNWCPEGYYWSGMGPDGPEPIVTHTDRLTACVLALESERRLT